MKLLFAFVVVVLCLSSAVVDCYRPSVFSASSTFIRTKAAHLYAAPVEGGETESVPMEYRTASVSQLTRKLSTPFALAMVAAAVLPPTLVARADEGSSASGEVATPAPTPAKVELGPAPTDWGLVQNDYYADAQKVVSHMRYACQMEKGNPLLAEIGQKCKDEMIDFVSFYRRFNGISGKQSFSLLYTSVNVLSGHYTSYGTKIPVPEKRKKRLLQEFNDIEKNIRKKR